MKETLQKRVARGAKLLDKRCPGWAVRLDFERLNILDPRNCVLAQLYGHYLNGLFHLGIIPYPDLGRLSLSGLLDSTKGAQPLGFCGDTTLDLGMRSEQVPILEQAWRKEAEARRAALPQPEREEQCALT